MNPDQFRQETRDWLMANCPESERQPIVKEQQIWAGRNSEFYCDNARLWFERMRDKGWTTPEWPEQYGGADLSQEQAKILQAEMRKLGCRPPLYDLGLWMFGPTLLEFGNEQQKADHLPKIARGEIRWCQGYSEPGAGSDLASLKTKAEDQGDHFLVNGSKIWTTRADAADWIFCLVRTDPQAEKQRGISFLLIDMETEGVSTRPIPLISGESEFCETFFDDVKVPKTNMVGELHQGWTVAKGLLKHERALMSNMAAISEDDELNVVDTACRYLARDDQGKLKNSGLRDQLCRHLMSSAANDLTGQRLFLEGRAGTLNPGLPLIMKYINTREVQNRDEVLMAILGNRGLSWNDAEFTEREQKIVSNWAYDKTFTIAGGTSEIQLNIIAKRALELPD